MLAMIAILLGVIAIGGGYFVLNTRAADVTLEQANTQSPSAFDPSLTAAPSTTPSPTPSEATKPPPAGPNGLAIYGGTGNNRLCDKQKLIDFLTTHPAEGRAWAVVEGITPAEIPAFIGQLDPEILSRDTRVTNHGFVNGRATAYQSVFQAGTAVLVNQYGYPVSRCLCGNPLTPPVTNQRVRYVGTQWPGFSQAAIVIYVPLPGSMPNGQATVPAGGQSPTPQAGIVSGEYTGRVDGAQQTGDPGAVTCDPIGTTIKANITQTGHQVIWVFTALDGSTDSNETGTIDAFGKFDFEVTVPNSSDTVSYKGAVDPTTGIWKGTFTFSRSSRGVTGSCVQKLTMVPSSPPVPATTMSALAGTWGAHATVLVITSTGAGHLTYADLTKCPSCSVASAPRGTVDFVLTTVASGGAAGHVTNSSDPANWAVGAPVKASLTPAIPGPGQFLSLVINGTPLTYFCNSTSVGQCGA